ncbi:MAG: YkvA family protein [Devosia sp.]
MTRGHGMALDGEILGPETLDEENVKNIKRRFWPTLKKALGQIPFAHDVVAAYYCAMDPDVPMRVRMTLLGALAYFVAPIDAIPDVLLGIGFGDDATVLAAAIAMVAAHINEKHRAKARAALQD